MGMKWNRLSAVFAAAVLGACVAWSVGQNSAAQGLSQDELTALLAPSRTPDRVILNLAADPARGVGVSWRTDMSVTTPVLEFALATPGPQMADAATRIGAQTTPISNDWEDEPEIRAHFHAADISGLTPDTAYVYRVGDGEVFSEWYQFRTAASGDAPFSFIYFGDAQNDIKAMWSRVIRQSVQSSSDIDFFLHAGDLVNKRTRDLEWHEWHAAGGWAHAQIPSIMTPGNHEYVRPQWELTPYWRAGFNLPENGPVDPAIEELASETVYYVDYHNARLISVDSVLLAEHPQTVDAQLAWLSRVLAENPGDWSIVFIHYPVFGHRAFQDEQQRMRALLRPVMDAHRVDLVLQGHDHAYARGEVQNLSSGAGARSPAGTMYVVSVSGPKMYDSADAEWMDVSRQGAQLYQLIEVDGRTLNYVAYDATGEVYDEFTLQK